MRTFLRARAVLEPRVQSNPADAEATALPARVHLEFGDLDAALPLAERYFRKYLIVEPEGPQLT